MIYLFARHQAYVLVHGIYSQVTSIVSAHTKHNDVGNAFLI